MNWEPTKHGGFRRTGVAQGERRPNTAEVGGSKRPPVPEAGGRARHGRLVTLAWRENLGLPECPYLIRWRLEFRGLGSLRVHHWLGPDDDRAHHDHPWWFLTFVVRGCYGDQSPDDSAAGYRTEFLKAPAVRFRPALHRHTVVPGPGGAWTVMVTGPRTRTWGFWPGGTKFVKANKWFASRGHHPCA